MGTRNLTCVAIDGKYAVAQYGQWDGYPEGQGKTILEFLRNKFDSKKFEERLKSCRFVDDKEIERLYKEAEVKVTEFPGAGKGMTMEDAGKFRTRHPQLDRDMCGKILEFIQNSKGDVPLSNGIGFAGDSLFCEWAYIVDLDKGTFEVYRGFNKRPLGKTARFFGAERTEYKTSTGYKYYPIRLYKIYKLSKLPTVVKFLKDCEEKED